MALGKHPNTWKMTLTDITRGYWILLYGEQVNNGGTTTTFYVRTD